MKQGFSADFFERRCEALAFVVLHQNLKDLKD
jgi:hypothetical protein